MHFFPFFLTSHSVVKILERNIHLLFLDPKNSSARKLDEEVRLNWEAQSLQLIGALMMIVSLLFAFSSTRYFGSTTLIAMLPLPMFVSGRNLRTASSAMPTEWEIPSSSQETCSLGSMLSASLTRPGTLSIGQICHLMGENFLTERKRKWTMWARPFASQKRQQWTRCTTHALCPPSS